MYNPHVTDAALVTFLNRFCDVTSAARRVRDSLGFWNGRRQFQVLLRPDEQGFDGYIHPPALFSLGADRGTLFYARQAPFCRRCRTAGHGQSECGGQRCRVCKSLEHTAKDCTQPRACHGCGSIDHLYRDCQARQKSFSEVAGGGASSGLGVGESSRERDGDQGGDGGGGESVPGLCPVPGEEHSLPGVVEETRRSSESPSGADVLEDDGGPLGALEEELRGFMAVLADGQAMEEEMAVELPAEATPALPEAAGAVLASQQFRRVTRRKAKGGQGAGQSGVGGMEEGERKRARGEAQAAMVVSHPPSQVPFPQPPRDGQPDPDQLVGGAVSSSRAGTPEPLDPTNNIGSWASQVEEGEVDRTEKDCFT